ncbi:NUDIX hydrolase [Neobacillus sp. LXY-4]|uniref:NUDIX hydrolase n=1 Tax=Neobacillus sp. LXY-4 TaxID=3379826 RepID=UPI003EE0BEE0
MEINQILKRMQNRDSTMLDSSKFTKFAVLLPLIEKDDGLHILFEVRAYNMRRQPGEICFPGGKVDPDDINEQFTAIRETSEELGIHPSSIRHVFPLDYMVTPFGTIIYPFLGVMENEQQIQPNHAEVAEVFTVPLEFFQNVKPEIFKVHFSAKPEQDFPFDLIIGGENYNWQTRHIDEYFYKYGDKVIWGLTARILSHFLEELEI